MAKVTLWRTEVSPPGDLPPICIRCGAPADTTVDRTLWANTYGLPFLITPDDGIFFADPVPLRLPFCAGHQNHWRWRAWLVWGSLPLLGLLAFTAIIVAILSNRWTELGAVAWGLGIAAVFAVPSWVTLVIALKLTGIHCVGLERREIVLAGVDPLFVESIEERRRIEEEAKRR